MKNLPESLLSLLNAPGPYAIANCITFRAPVLGSYISGDSGPIFLAINDSDGDIAIVPDGTIPTNCQFSGIFPPQGIPASHLPSGLPSGSVYCSSIPMERSRLSVKCGLGTDNIDVTIYPRPSDSIYGVSLFEAAIGGVFDAATVDVFRVLWSPGSSPAWGGGVIIFAGKVADLEDVSRTSMKIVINDFTELLDVDFPRNVYSPYCPFLLYGPGCGLSKAPYTFTGTVSSSPSPSSTYFSVTGISNPDGYFSQGVYEFTSGILNGLAGTVKSHIGNSIVPLQMMPGGPSAGDSVTLFAGCDRTWTTCGSKFNNSGMFGGCPFIPPPDTMLPPIVQAASGGGGK